MLEYRFNGFYWCSWGKGEGGAGERSGEISILFVLLWMNKSIAEQRIPCSTSMQKAK